MNQPTPFHAHRSRNFCRTLACRLTGGCFFLLAAMAAPAQDISFNFHPPDHLSYTITHKATIVEDKDWLGQDTQTVTYKQRQSIKKTPTGYILTVTYLSASATLNGQPYKSPVLAALRNSSILFVVDEKGKLISLKGVDQLQNKIVGSLSENLPDSLAQQLAAQANLDSLSQSMTDSWKEDVPRFVGRKGRIGDIWLAADHYVAPGTGDDTFYTAIQLAGLEKCGGGKECVRFRYTNNSDLEVLKSSLKAGNSPTEIEDLAAEKPERPEITMTGTKERLVDPATLLIYSETMNRVIKVPTDVPGQGKVTITVTGKSVDLYDYSVPSAIPSKPSTVKKGKTKRR